MDDGTEFEITGNATWSKREPKRQNHTRDSKLVEQDACKVSGMQGNTAMYQQFTVTIFIRVVPNKSPPLTTKRLHTFQISMHNDVQSMKKYRSECVCGSCSWLHWQTSCHIQAYHTSTVALQCACGCELYVCSTS